MFLTGADQIGMIAEHYGITRDDVFSRSRKAKIVQARQHCYWHFRARGRSFPEIARLLKVKDHTTVMHGCKRHMERHALVEITPMPRNAGYSEGLLT